MSKQDNKFLLFASCVPVCGYKQTIIYDLQNNVGKVISNSLYELLKLSESLPIDKIQELYHDIQHDDIDFLLNFFETNNIGFFTNTPHNFPKLNLDWESPYKLTNVILEIAETTKLEKETFNLIEESGCQAMQLRFLYSPDINEINRVIKFFSKSRLRYVEILVKFHSKYTLDNYYEIMKYDGRILTLYVYNAENNKTLKVTGKSGANIFSQPSKCTYNPFIALWKGQKGYVSVEQCGEYNSEKQFIPDYDKINKINETIDNTYN